MDSVMLSVRVAVLDRLLDGVMDSVDVFVEFRLGVGVETFVFDIVTHSVPVSVVEFDGTFDNDAVTVSSFVTVKLSDTVNLLTVNVIVSLSVDVFERLRSMRVALSVMLTVFVSVNDMECR